MKNYKGLVLLAMFMLTPCFFVGDTVRGQAEDGEVQAFQRQVIAVENYDTNANDPNDWLYANPGDSFELIVAQHYHYHRTGIATAGYNGPPGSSEEDVRVLPEGDNQPGSSLTVSDPEILQDGSAATFRVVVDASQAKYGDDFIVYFETTSVDTVDWRWPGHKVAGRPRSFQVHVHIGPTWGDYVRALAGN